MASESEIYISIKPEPYRASKFNILTNQVDLLSTLKRLQNLKVLARQKRDLKKKILKNLTIVINRIDSIQKEIPTTKIPKVISEIDNETKEIPTPKIPHVSTKTTEIEEELLAIQEKLRQLNS